jgi:hypothetical protein
MFNTGRRHTNFFKFAWLIIFPAVLLHSNPVYAQSEISPIQLKTIQIRKFKVPPDKVLAAISALHADLYDTQCSMAALPSQFFVSVKKIQFSCGISKVSPADRELKIVQYERLYELETNQELSEAVLRVRLYLTSGTVRAQSVNAARYQKHFKEIADTLFVEAIELPPSEMQ